MPEPADTPAAAASVCSVSRVPGLVRPQVQLPVLSDSRSVHCKERGKTGRVLYRRLAPVCRISSPEFLLLGKSWGGNGPSRATTGTKSQRAAILGPAAEISAPAGSAPHHRVQARRPTAQQNAHLLSGLGKVSRHNRGMCDALQLNQFCF